MIGYLSGILLSKRDPLLLINVHGVGYKVHASQDVLLSQHVGQEIEVYVYSHIREDIFELYGFSDQGSLDIFEQLISVSGIGPKTAINVFSLGTTNDIIAAIQKADVDFFTGVPRLGKKNAQKLIIELKHKIGSTQDLDLGDVDGGNEVVLALMGFGFSEQEVRSALRQIGDKGKTTSEKVRLALKYLGK